MLRIRKLTRCEIKVTTQKNQSAYEGKKKGNERGREARGTYFAKKIKKKTHFPLTWLHIGF